MGNRGSSIAKYIDKDYKREKHWKEKINRIKSLDEEASILILAEHSREPLIIENKGVNDGNSK